MKTDHDLSRFLDAQEQSYKAALNEIKKGRKQSHWMWYIFPQISGLGFSSTSRHYALKDLVEATSYLQHPVLGSRLQEITEVLLSLPEKNATQIFGSPDDLKLKSSMTLFMQVSGASPIFEDVLKKYFNGSSDLRTLTILSSQAR